MEGVFKPYDRLVYPTLVLVDLAAALWFVRHWAGLGDWAEHPFLVGTASLILLYRLGAYGVHWTLLPLMRRPSSPPEPPTLRVGVATTFVPALESFDMLARTVRALAAMPGAHDTWVLDEGDDERVRGLCEETGARHFTRRGVERYNAESGPFRARTKYGNYNAWLDAAGYASYDLIVAFDPDHVPEPGFLERTLGYFADPGIGYVQAAQVYYNQAASFIARGAAEETYAYYASGQMSSYALGYPIVNGCHNLHRTRALREIGGFAAHDADDLLMTLRYRSSGWGGVYVPEILARGLTPVDWDSYLRQQRRWARSVLDIKLRAWPREVGRMRLRERIISGLHGLYYLRGVTSFAVILLLGLMAATGIVPHFVSYSTGGRLLALLALLTVTDFYRQRFFLDPRREFGLHWRAGLLGLAKWPQLLIAAFEVVQGGERPYSVTPKRRSTSSSARRSRSPLLVRPHVLIIAFFAACILAGVVAGRDVDPLVYLALGATVAGSVLVLLTALLEAPPPYDPELWPGPRPLAGRATA